MRHHQSQKNLATDFNHVCGLLDASGEQPLVTPNGHSFITFAGLATKGVHQGERVIRIEKGGKEFARIYPCRCRHVLRR